MSCFLRNAVAALILFSLPSISLGALGASTTFSFAGGQIDCTLVSTDESMPALVLTVLPIAIQSAVDLVGAPSEPAKLTIRLQEEPSFYERLQALFRAEAFAIQQGDEILLRAGDDPLKLAFRMGHECSHWLVFKRNSARPPLWLDEGLASLVGAQAAETCARVQKLTLDRPIPPALDTHLYTLDELVALHAYPAQADRSAAFYWQAEALVHAIRHRLGPAEFNVYLSLLSSTGAPNWQAPLRDRWYFSDWDLNWLAEQIRPPPASKSEPPPLHN